MTRYKVEALARMLGITPSTHRHLFDYDQPDFPGEGLSWQFKGPDPYAADADAVWVAPLMQWLRDHGHEPMLRSVSAELGWDANIVKGDAGEVAYRATTMTAALLDCAMQLPEFQRFKETDR